MNDAPVCTTAHAEAVVVVDLDGTLIHTDLLHESALKLLREDSLAVLRMPFWLARGKAALKDQIATRVALDVQSLPYHQPLLAWLREQRASGRTLVLCTASNERFAQAVAHHLGLFDAVIASDAEVNVSARRKAQILVDRYGEKAFDYAGNSADDLQVWPHARQALLVNAGPRVAARARQQCR
ncbi:MAG TPA: haloacid dehalogenase-like hydrolase, partial [Rubrivivax sp.]|nr:haloacid dehalogenase-like hydrolase [Rubrivivax sp.]